jgi:hypothetical protein
LRHVDRGREIVAFFRNFGETVFELFLIVAKLAEDVRPGLVQERAMLAPRPDAFERQRNQHAQRHQHQVGDHLAQRVHGLVRRVNLQGAGIITAARQSGLGARGQL